MNNNQNTKTSSAQSARILEHLTLGNSITAAGAYNRFQCMRLSARILDLKKAGHEIVDKWIVTRSKKRVKQYSLNV